MYSDNYELYHYGVKGMKWGHRKALPKSDLRNRFDRARAEKRAANKAYSKSFNKAYQRSSNPIPFAMTKKGRAKTNEAWGNTYDAAKRANTASNKFKAVKKERKQAINSAYKDINKNTKFGEKLLYSEGTRRKAAKFMVDNNMSMTDAKRKANKEAIRNTAAFMGAFGAMAVASYYKKTH